MKCEMISCDSKLIIVSHIQIETGERQAVCQLQLSVGTDTVVLQVWDSISLVTNMPKVITD